MYKKSSDSKLYSSVRLLRLHGQVSVKAAFCIAHTNQQIMQKLFMQTKILSNKFACNAYTKISHHSYQCCTIHKKDNKSQCTIIHLVKFKPNLTRLIHSIDTHWVSLFALTRSLYYKLLCITNNVHGKYITIYIRTLLLQ